MLDRTCPKTGSFGSQRLLLHMVEWGREGAEPVLLVHGFKDHGRSWDAIARDLARDFHLFAIDLRGHGDSDWSNGGAYSLDEFIGDVHSFVAQSGFSSINIIAHSMGGAVCLNYAGLYPERVKRLIAIEGTWEMERHRRGEPVLGPPSTVPESGTRMPCPPDDPPRAWLDQLDRLTARRSQPMRSLDEAQARLRLVHPSLSPDLLYHLAMHGVRQNADATFSWKHDPFVQARAPSRYGPQDMARLWGRIQCPVLLIHGAESDSGDALALGFDALFRDCTAVTVAHAGHWVHHDRPEDVIALARQALTGTGTAIVSASPDFQ